MHDYQAPQDLFNEKIILVTGAGDGIGKEAAKQYAAHGATVILLGKTTKKLEAVYDEIMAAGGPEPAIIPLDMRGATTQHYADMALTIEQTFGRLDGILHNAGLLGVLSPFAQIEEQTWIDIMQVNVTAAAFMTQALLPMMKKQDAASIVFTTSSVGRQGRAFWGTYAISKFATEGMMQTMADEYENSGVRVNCINPGATRTNMRARAYPAEDATRLKMPADIMPLYLYLMGKDSEGVTGQSFDAQPK